MQPSLAGGLDTGVSYRGMVERIGLCKPVKSGSSLGPVSCSTALDSCFLSMVSDLSPVNWVMPILAGGGEHGFHSQADLSRNLP